MGTKVRKINTFAFNLNQIFLIFTILAVVAICLSPYTGNGFWNDDAVNSSIRGELGRARVSLPYFSWQIAKGWFTAGRFFPLGLFQAYFSHYFMPDLGTFRMMHVLSVVVHILAFSGLLRKLRVSWSLIGLWLICLMGTFQVRDWHDPIASYGFLLQTQGILLVCALFGILRWMDSE